MRGDAWLERGVHQGKPVKKPGSRPSEDSILTTPCPTPACGDRYRGEDLGGRVLVQVGAIPKLFCSLACAARWTTRQEVKAMRR